MQVEKERKGEKERKRERKREEERMKERERGRKDGGCGKADAFDCFPTVWLIL